jgi:hypothetical protein
MGHENTRNCSKKPFMKFAGFGALLQKSGTYKIPTKSLAQTGDDPLKTHENHELLFVLVLGSSLLPSNQLSRGRQGILCSKALFWWNAVPAVTP